MRFNLKSLCVLTTLVLLFYGCRKGEDDPVISLRTRKARVAGKWKVKSGSYYFKYNLSDYSYSYSESAFEGRYIYITDPLSVPVITEESGAFSYTMEFSKDGTFKSTQILKQDTTIETGTWNFLGASGSYKKKERIIISIQSVYYGVNKISYSYSGNRVNISPDRTFQVKELRNKKMRIEYSRGEDQAYGSDYRFQEIYTLEQ